MSGSRLMLPVVVLGCSWGPPLLLRAARGAQSPRLQLPAASVLARGFLCCFLGRPWVLVVLGCSSCRRVCLAPAWRGGSLFDCSLEFRRTLKIIARILREVVNRVKLGGHHTQKVFARPEFG